MLSHGVSQSQSDAAPERDRPARRAELPLEAPADAPTVEEQIAIDEVQAERLRDAAQDARETRDDGQAYVASGLPGWGFFTAIGVTLFIFWWLMRALGRHRRELREDEARARRAA